MNMVNDTKHSYDQFKLSFQDILIRNTMTLNVLVYGVNYFIRYNVIHMDYRPVLFQ